MEDSKGVFLGLLICSIYMAGVIGWVLNIVKLIGGEGNTTLRVVGILLAPLGSVIGWF
jgi:hypothetical protein